MIRFTTINDTLTIMTNYYNYYEHSSDYGMMIIVDIIINNIEYV